MLSLRAARSPGVRVAVMWLGVCAAACRPSDPALQIAVDERLSHDRETGWLSLDIAVNRGVIHLAGEVSSRDQRRRIVELARSVDGVKDVVDAMHLSDEVIAAAVRRALAADPLVGHVPIDVAARRGIVSLMSEQTDKDQRVRAREIAAKVDGVARVDDLMR